MYPQKYERGFLTRAFAGVNFRWSLLNQTGQAFLAHDPEAARAGGRGAPPRGLAPAARLQRPPRPGAAQGPHGLVN